MVTSTRPFTRAQILNRLHASLRQGRPVIGAACSSGLIARAAEVGGADLIVVYSTGTSRLMGLPTTLTMNHANPSTIAMYPGIANVVRHTPLIGGTEPSDPTYLDLPGLVHHYRDTGFDGLINFPNTGVSATMNRERRRVGLGIERDFELVRIARDLDYFTCCYSYTEEQTVGLVAAGADVVVVQAGRTAGGLAGAGPSAMSMDQTCEHVQHLVRAAQQENPDVICMVHGGPISRPEDTRYLYDHTDAQGVLAASSLERIPVENAVIAAVKAFKAGHPRALPRQAGDARVPTRAAG